MRHDNGQIVQDEELESVVCSKQAERRVAD
jgi:hypothetical protein